MSSRYQYQNQYPRYGNYGGYNNRRYSNRNWARSTGSAKPIDPRKYGDYTNKDDIVLSKSVSIISWLGRRIICFYHAGVFYFGRKAIKLLENQAQFILPVLEQVSNNYYAQPSDRYSFGIVPHVGDSEKMVCVGQEDAFWLLFNFLASNVLPVTFDPNNALRIQDMFESPDNEEAFCGSFGEVYDNIMQNPINPLNYDAVVGVIGDLFNEGLLVSRPWEKEYRRNYRSWTEPLEMGRQLQPPLAGQQPSPMANGNQDGQGQED